MQQISVKADQLQVGDVFPRTGSVITSVETYTTPGYGERRVRTVDNGLVACEAVTWPADLQINVLRG